MSLLKGSALVTGANRGLGLETARQLAAKGLTVYMGCRDAVKAEAAAASLADRGLKARSLTIDTSDPVSIGWARDFFTDQLEPLRILVNNAAIQLEAPGSWNAADATCFKADPAVVETTFATNVRGPMLLMQALVPLMRKNGLGRVVNVSSGMGQLSDMRGGWMAYRLSKTALNSLTRIFAAETPEPNVKINSVCPGWVRTDMGGTSATRTVEEGASGIVWAATLPDNGPTGGFFRDGAPIPW